MALPPIEDKKVEIDFGDDGKAPQLGGASSPFGRQPLVPGPSGLQNPHAIPSAPSLSAPSSASTSSSSYTPTAAGIPGSGLPSVPVVTRPTPAPTAVTPSSVPVSTPTARQAPAPTRPVMTAPTTSSSYASPVPTLNDIERIRELEKEVESLERANERLKDGDFRGQNLTIGQVVHGLASRRVRQPSVGGDLEELTRPELTDASAREVIETAEEILDPNSSDTTLEEREIQFRNLEAQYKYESMTLFGADHKEGVFEKDPISGRELYELYKAMDPAEQDGYRQFLVQNGGQNLVDVLDGDFKGFRGRELPRVIDAISADGVVDTNVISAEEVARIVTHASPQQLMSLYASPYPEQIFTPEVVQVMNDKYGEGGQRVYELFTGDSSPSISEVIDAQTDIAGLIFADERDRFMQQRLDSQALSEMMQFGSQNLAKNLSNGNMEITQEALEHFENDLGGPGKRLSELLSTKGTISAQDLEDALQAAYLYDINQRQERLGHELHDAEELLHNTLNMRETLSRAIANGDEELLRQVLGDDVLIEFKKGHKLLSKVHRYVGKPAKGLGVLYDAFQKTYGVYKNIKGIINGQAKKVNIQPPQLVSYKNAKKADGIADKYKIEIKTDKSESLVKELSKTADSNSKQTKSASERATDRLNRGTLSNSRYRLV